MVFFCGWVSVIDRWKHTTHLLPFPLESLAGALQHVLLHPDRDQVSTQDVKAASRFWRSGQATAELERVPKPESQDRIKELLLPTSKMSNKFKKTL